jgi:hypothetical protein
MADFSKNLRASLFNDDLSSSAGSISLDSTFNKIIEVFVQKNVKVKMNIFYFYAHRGEAFVCTV